MRQFRQVLAGFGLLFLGVMPSATQTSAAQTNTAQNGPRTVRVEEAEDGRMHYLLPRINQEVIDAFSARVSGSTRYTLTQAPAELLVIIVCQDARKNNAPGAFCTYRFEYRPKKIPEFNVPLGEPTVVAHPVASEIAEDIFQDFVKETTETHLSVAELEVTMRVANFCSKAENQMPCSGKFQ
jgi:hypothetical protein